VARAATAPAGRQDNILRRLPRGTLALVLLTALLVAALLGVFGGGKSPWQVVRSPHGDLAVKTPVILRSGLFFEQVVRIEARRPVADLVVAIDAALMRDMTINTMIPAPSEEQFEDGSFRFSFGPLAPGEFFQFKLDGQVNPSLVGGNAGAIAWYDGDRRIASLPLDIKVFP
jgi:hypothetical protein